MAGFDHSGVEEQEWDSVATSTRNARLGMAFFVVYSVVYAGFVLLSAFWPEALDTIVWMGVNLAVVYGLGLIAFAFVLSLAYGWLCRSPAADSGRRGEHG